MSSNLFVLVKSSVHGNVALPVMCKSGISKKCTAASCVVYMGLWLYGPTVLTKIQCKCQNYWFNLVIVAIIRCNCVCNFPTGA